MPEAYVRRGSALAPNQYNRPAANTFRVHSTTDELKFGTGASGTTEKTVADLSSTQTLAAKTLTSPVINNAVVAAQAATLAVTAAAHDGKTIVLDRAAGVTVTLPAAAGTGAKFRFRVLTALSAASHVIQAASGTDYFRGVIVSKDDGTASSVISWATANTGTAATESDTLTLDGSTKGGNTGDLIEFEDIGAAVWAVVGITKSSGTEATPFSAAV